METKYMIKDLDTGLLYKNMLLGCSSFFRTHTFGKGWDRPEPTGADYWTDDPDLAFQLYDAAGMIEFINSGLKRVGSHGQFTTRVCFSDGSGRAKQLVVVEYGE